METINWREGADKDTLVHRIQAVHDKKRKLKELDNELKEQRLENEREKKRLKQTEKELFIDLIKSKKIKIVEMTTLEELRVLLTSQAYHNQHAFCYTLTTDSADMQFMKVLGEEKLEENDAEHWELFKEDYFYYGSPNYRDINDPLDELSERQLGQESGDWVLNVLGAQ